MRKNLSIIFLFSFLGLAFLAGCRSKPTPTLVSTPELPAQAQPTQVPTLLPADYADLVAGICASPAQGEVVTIEIRIDIPDPRCLQLTPAQRMKVHNVSDEIVQVWLGGYTLQVEPGEEALLDVPLGSIFAPGLHYITAQPYGGPELVMLEAE